MTFKSIYNCKIKKLKINLISSGIFFKIYLIYLGIKYKYFLNKKTYSQFGEDKIIENFFGGYIGTYVDIGCFHPIKYSNTALLNKKGWCGVNIDLNETSIKLFNACRKNDININACLSDKKQNVTIYMESEFSALNSIYAENYENFKFKNLKKIKTQTKIFSDLIKNDFDFLNIDCEGNDYKILKSINLKFYKPELINIEVYDDTKNNIYQYLHQNGYELLIAKSVSHIFKRKISKII